MTSEPASRDEELHRIREAIERLERDQPSRFESILNALTNLLKTLIDSLLGRVRSEIEGARRAGQELVARVLHAVSRSLRHFAHALAYAFVAALFVTIGFVVLTIAVVVALNQRLGDPWGTFATAGIFLIAALVLAMFARGKTSSISGEAEALAPRHR